MKVLKTSIFKDRVKFVDVVAIVRHDAINHENYTEEFYSVKLHKRLFDREYVDNKLVKTRTSFAEFNKAFKDEPDMFLMFINKNINKSVTDNNIEVIQYSRYDLKRRFGIDTTEFRNAEEN